MKILRHEVEETRIQLNILNCKLYNIHFELSSTIKLEDFIVIDSASYINAENVYEQVSSSHQKKFDKLYTAPKKKELSSDKVIINLTDKQLDPPTISALKKGLNFAVAPNRIPTEKIISGVEAAIRRIPTDTSEEIRQEIATIIRKSKLPKRNVTKQEIQALKELRSDESTTVIPADKGNATVLMKTTEYKEKMHSLLEAQTN